MTPLHLIDDMAAWLRPVLQSYEVHGATGDTKPVSVYTYYADIPDAYDASPREPYVLLRPLGGTDDWDESTAKCAIVVAVRDEDGKDGYVQTMNLLEHIRQHLLTSAAVANKYPIKRPIQWGIDNEPNIPVYMGYITVEVNIGHLDNAGAIPFLLGEEDS